LCSSVALWYDQKALVSCGKKGRHASARARKGDLLRRWWQNGGLVAGAQAGTPTEAEEPGRGEGRQAGLPTWFGWNQFRGDAERAARVPEPGRPEELGCREGDEPGCNRKLVFFQ
jgi:hypothetical protein